MEGVVVVLCYGWRPRVHSAGEIRGITEDESLMRSVGELSPLDYAAADAKGTKEFW